MPETTYGLHPMHYALVLKDTYFPPSEFAIAWVGTTPKKELERIVDETVSRIESGELREDQVPYLHHTVHAAQAEGRRFSLEDLREMAKREYKTAKIIDRTAAMPVNAAGQLGTMSSRHTLSMRITSRKKGQVQRPYQITLYNPIVKEHEQARNFKFRGSSMHEEKKHAKGLHWSVSAEEEEQFIIDLGDKIRKQSEKESATPWISPEEIQDHYHRDVSIADYPIACGLTTLDRIARLDKKALLGLTGHHPDAYARALLRTLKQGKKGLIEGPAIEGWDILLPYNFSRTPELAIECFIRKHGAKKLQQSLFEIDDFLRGKVLISEVFAGLMRKGVVQRGVVVDHKRFERLPKAMIQAWEAYYYSKMRRFDLYSLEFAGTDFQTVSIVFDDIRKPDLSMRIIYDDNFRLPYVMYVDSSPKGLKSENRPLGDRNPAAMINPPKEECRRSGRDEKKWKGADYRTGKEAVFSIHEPKREIIKTASRIYERYNGKDKPTKEIEDSYVKNAERIDREQQG